MMHFPSVSHFPLFPKKICDSAENVPNLTFSKKHSDFHPPKFLTTFLKSFPSTFENFPPDFVKFACFYILHTLRVFRFFPTFTMMHLCITQCTYWTPLFLTYM